MDNLPLWIIFPRIHSLPPTIIKGTIFPDNSLRRVLGTHVKERVQIYVREVVKNQNTDFTVRLTVRGVTPPNLASVNIY